MISVIVPIYNAEQTLSQCIDSILSQKYSNFEVLLIDDGSTDNSGKICDIYSQKDKRIKVFHQRNQGVSAARNLGLAHIKGEFVTFCDSDDWVEDTWLLDYINNYHGEDVLYQNARWWKNTEILLDRNVSLSPSMGTFERIKKLYLANTLFYIWSGLWKSDIIKQYKLRFSNVKLWEDGIWSCQFCSHIQSINIIPSNKCHHYNYNYRFPTATRDYQKINKDKFRAMIMNLDSFDALCKSFNKKNEYIFFSQKISPIIFNNILLLYKENKLTKEKRLEILNLILKEKQRLFLNNHESYKLKMVKLLLFKNCNLSDKLFKIIL